MFGCYFELLILEQLALLIHFLAHAHGSKTKVNDLDDPACKAESCYGVHVGHSSRLFSNDDVN